MFDGPVGLVSLNAGATVVTIVVTAGATAAFTQESRIASGTRAVLQIERVGPRVGFFVDSPIIVLPGRGTHFAGSTILAVQDTSRGFLAIQIFTVWPGEAVEAFTGMIGVADPARFAAVHVLNEKRVCACEISDMSRMNRKQQQWRICSLGTLTKQFETKLTILH